MSIAQVDLEFWTNEDTLSDPALGRYIGPIRDTLLPLRGRIVFLKDGQEIVAGMQALSTPGHTVGHTSFVISSQLAPSSISAISLTTFSTANRESMR